MDNPTTANAEPAPIPSERSEGTGPFFYPLCFMLVIAVYALSPAPIAKALRLGTRPEPKAFDIAYAPLDFLDSHFRPVRCFYNWYFKDVWHLP